MNYRKAPALLLAVALQIVPLSRVACLNQATAPTGFAVIFRWLAGAAALLGSYHAVSGASAAIAGVYPYNPVNGLPTGPVSTNATGAVGQAFNYEIDVTNPGVNNAQAYYRAGPLPPGLTLNTNIGANNGRGLITGTPTAGGQYAVTLYAGNANCVCLVSLPITINISGGGATPPAITVPPANQTVQAGANVSFTVTATGTTPLSYLWRFNGTAIDGATTSSLQLTNVQTTSSGTYTVGVTNSAGGTSAAATLMVNPAATPPTISAQPQSLTVSNGAAVSFTAGANGSAPLSYQWHKGATALPGATSSSYSIAAASTNDAATYSVVITNAAGSITSAVATLTVLVPPSIVTPPQSMTVSNGTAATLTVAAAGSPPLAYQWLFNGGLLAGATSSSLTISNAQSANQGDYTVTVTNAVGSVTSPAAHLTVQSQGTGTFLVSNPVLSSGSLSFDVVGPPQTNFVLWTSTNLKLWTPVGTNFSTSGTMHYSETNLTGPTEFYRATLGH
jgi:hypothetical protein